MWSSCLRTSKYHSINIKELKFIFSFDIHVIEGYVSPIQTHVCHKYHAYKYKLNVAFFFSCCSFLYLHFLLPVCVLYIYISYLWCLSPFNSTCVAEFLNIYLIDAVSGSMVFSVSHKRAREPVHIVHSENWLLYSYFSEKSRRTEIVTLELYEGKVQSNTTGKIWNTALSLWFVRFTARGMKWIYSEEIMCVYLIVSSVK